MQQTKLISHFSIVNTRLYIKHIYKQSFRIHIYTCISVSNKLAVGGPASSLMPPTPVSETTGEALGVRTLREVSDGEKVGVIAVGVSPVFLAKGE